MKHKTNQTIAKRTRTRPSGQVLRTIAGQQHLRRRKSKRQLKATKQGTANVNRVDLKITR